VESVRRPRRQSTDLREFLLSFLCFFLPFSVGEDGGRVAKSPVVGVRESGRGGPRRVAVPGVFDEVETTEDAKDQWCGIAWREKTQSKIPIDGAEEED